MLSLLLGLLLLTFIGEKTVPRRFDDPCAAITGVAVEIVAELLVCMEEEDLFFAIAAQTGAPDTFTGLGTPCETP